MSEAQLIIDFNAKQAELDGFTVTVPANSTFDEIIEVLRVARNDVKAIRDELASLECQIAQLRINQ